MRNLWKRVLICLLSVGMVLSLSGVTALATETDDGSAVSAEDSSAEVMCDSCVVEEEVCDDCTGEDDCDCCCCTEDADEGVQSLSDQYTSSVANHGDMKITSEEADGDVITMAVDEEAEIVISPYAHNQYYGCVRPECPDTCNRGPDCFIPMFGCDCGTSPALHYATVDVDILDPDIVSAGEVTAEGDPTALELGEITDGTLSLTANKAGTTTVTITTKLKDWVSATETYTVTVEGEETESGATVSYAVKIWGIEADTYSCDGGKTSATTGLTFGPALGGVYIASYKSCDSAYCIHNMSWDEIIAQSKKDPTVFESCMENGCTKAVELTPNDTLFNMETVENAVAREYTGDGVTTLYNLLNGAGSTDPDKQYGAVWNASTDGYSAEDPANVYSRSRIRTTLTGDQTNIVNWMNENSDANDYYGVDTLCDESNCLLSCLPTELQEAVVPRTTLNTGNATRGTYRGYDTTTTYDKLFLFSLKEIGVTNTGDDGGGDDYGVNSNGWTAYEFSDTSAAGATHQRWWMRSRYGNNNYQAFYMGLSSTEGAQWVYNADYGGLSFGFCLPGTEEYVPAEPYPESDHPYANGTDQSWTYTLNDADNGVYVTFDEQTATESGYDFIYIYDGDGNEMFKISGTGLAGSTLYIPTDSFTVRLTADSSVNDWGFAITDVEAAGEKIDLGIAGVVDDPLAPVQQYETPDVDVQVNFVSLEEGVDYTVSFDTSVIGEYATVTITAAEDSELYTGTLTTHVFVYDDTHVADPTAAIDGDWTLLRQSSDAGSGTLSFVDMNNAYSSRITEITFRPIEEDGATTEPGDAGYPQSEVTITRNNDATRYSQLAENEFFMNGDAATFYRTEKNPVVYVLAGHGEPYIDGDECYPSSQVYEVTVKATGYADMTGTTTYYTGTNSTFSIIIDTDGNRSTKDDRETVYTWTSEELAEMSTFANGSSQCGMTGFRTFTSMGVSLEDLLEKADVSVSDDDYFEINTSDAYGNRKTYDNIFGSTRYFISGIYDPEFKDVYEAAGGSGADAAGTRDVRLWLGEYAYQHGTTVKPRLCSSYREDLIYEADIMAGLTLPTEENTVFNSLVSHENQFRFVYGIELVQEDCEVTFDTQGGSEVPSQTVLSHHMTSTSNTTMWSSYWVNSLIIYRGLGPEYNTDPTPLTGADAIDVPEEPTKEGYVFAGWYTDEECTDGNEFDFGANDGTVDEDTTLYAKWLPEDEVIGVVDFDITSGEHDDADGELNQTIIATITFSDDIALAHEDLRDDLLITIAGGDVYDTDRTITYEVQNGNQLVITMVSTDWVAITSGMLEIKDLTGKGIVAADSNKTVIMATQSGRIPTGIVVDNDMIAGTDAEPASTYVAVAHKANMRGMYAFELVSIGADGSETVVSSGSSHAHNFYTDIDEAAIASAIAGSFSGLDGYTVEYTEGDDYFIITANDAVEGEQLAVRMVEWKAEINKAHAPVEVVTENGKAITRCSFCGEVFAEVPITTENSALVAAIEAAQALDDSKYTSESWAALADALDAAEEVLNDPDATQDAINEATVNLVTAIADLEKAGDDDTKGGEPVNKADLLNEYVQDMQLNDSDYTSDSWQALADALEKAQDVLTSPDVTQDDVDEALLALQSARRNLEPSSAVDKTLLNEAIEEAGVLNGADFTEDSWAAVESALDAAKAVSEDDTATQEAVNKATVNLVNAIAELVKVDGTSADKSALEKEYDADMQLSKEDYTTSSWEALTDALSSAQKVLTNPDATQDEVDNALAELQSAKDALVEAADKTVLKAAMDAADALNSYKDYYTKESWNKLQEALDAADDVMKNGDATQSEVNEATVNLMNALADLEPVDQTAVNKTVLEAAISAATALDDYKDYYTEESWNKLQEALTAAKEAMDSDSATQGDVDDATVALIAALAALEPAGESGTGGETKEGLCMIEKGVKWGYYKDNEVDTSFTGFVNNESGDWYIQNGYVVFAASSANGVFKDADGAIGPKGTWYYVVRGKVKHDTTGLAHYKNQYGWWYIKNGEVDFTHNGVEKNQNGWWYVTGGKVQFGFTGLANYKNQYGWWYITNGKVNFSANTVAKNKNGWWYVTGGKVQFNFTGLAHYKNQYGWWYIKGGKVTFDYTGIASNQNGTWYVKNSKVQFGYSGTVTSGGRTYTVRNGKVR